MKQPLISVIIPVYMTETYLKPCIESVLSQTYQNIEIILIDDGSLDECPLICDAYAERDIRIHVIHKENGGLSSARNAGLDIAQGEYIAFLDSDDLWHPLFLQRMYMSIEDNNADVAVCQFSLFDWEISEATEKNVPPRLLDQLQAYECLFDSRNINMVVAWNKLYHRTVLDGIRYPEGQLHEDEAVIHRIIGRVNRVVWLTEELYYYRRTPGSITTARFNIRRLDETKAKEDRIAYFESIGRADLADRTRIVYLSNLMRLYRTVQYELEDRKIAKDTCNALHSRFREIYRKALIVERSWRFRMKCFFFDKIPTLYSMVEYHRLKRRFTK